MKKIGHLTLKILVLIVLNDVMDSVAQLLIKKGLLNTGINSVDFGNILLFVSQNAASLFVWLGLSIYIASFLLWMIIISRIELSIALPIGSVCYILTPLFALIFLHEYISPLRWLGIILITAGIYFVSESKRQSMEAS